MRKYLVLLVLGLAYGSAGQAQSEVCGKKAFSIPAEEQLLWLSGEGAQSYCQAQCADGSWVSTSCSGACTAVDAECPSSPYGYVACNGVYMYCSASCAPELCEGLSCGKVHGRSCSVQGDTTACCGSDGNEYPCDCLWGQWVCTI